MGAKDSFDFREFVDFLCSYEAAILCTDAEDLWREQSQMELNLFKLKSCALVVLSQVTNQRAVTIGVFTRHPTCLYEEKHKGEQRLPGPKQNLNQENSSTSQERNKEKPQTAQSKETTTTAMSNRVVHDQINTQTSAIIPVWLSSATHPTQ